MFISRAALGLSILGFSISAAQASTFKIAISLMGFDATFLQDEHSPTLPYQPGDPDWGGPAWLEPTDAVRWLQYSVQARPSLEWRTRAAMKPTDTAGLSVGRQCSLSA
jgi:hypothetical protein